MNEYININTMSLAKMYLTYHRYTNNKINAFIIATQIRLKILLTDKPLSSLRIIFCIQ